MKSAIFFDRDGIVNKRLVGDYVKTVEEFEFLDDFFALFEFASQKGYLSFVVSNQQGIAKGLMTGADLVSVTRHMQSHLFARYHRGFDEVYYCSDAAESNSMRRKPAPGMLFEAIHTFGIDAHRSWMIGDSISDVVAGKTAGVKTILVGDYSNIPQADFIVAHLSDVLAVLEQHA